MRRFLVAVLSIAWSAHAQATLGEAMIELVRTSNGLLGSYDDTLDHILLGEGLRNTLSPLDAVVAPSLSQNSQDSLSQNSQDSLSQNSQDSLSQNSQDSLSQNSQDSLSQNSQDSLSQNSQDSLSQNSQDSLSQNSQDSLSDIGSKAAANYLNITSDIVLWSKHGGASDLKDETRNRDELWLQLMFGIFVDKTFYIFNKAVDPHLLAVDSHLSQVADKLRSVRLSCPAGSEGCADPKQISRLAESVLKVEFTLLRLPKATGDAWKATLTKAKVPDGDREVTPEDEANIAREYLAFVSKTVGDTRAKVAKLKVRWTAGVEALTRGRRVAEKSGQGMSLEEHSAFDREIKRLLPAMERFSDKYAAYYVPNEEDYPTDIL